MKNPGWRGHGEKLKLGTRVGVPGHGWTCSPRCSGRCRILEMPGPGTENQGRLRCGVELARHRRQTVYAPASKAREAELPRACGVLSPWVNPTRQTELHVWNYTTGPWICITDYFDALVFLVWRKNVFNLFFILHGLSVKDIFGYFKAISNF